MYFVHTIPLITNNAMSYKTFIYSSFNDDTQYITLRTLNKTVLCYNISNTNLYSPVFHTFMMYMTAIHSECGMLCCAAFLIVDLRTRYFGSYPF